MQTGAAEILPLLEHNCYDVYMPDIRHVGGISGMMKFSAVLEAFDVLISPHNACSAVAFVASLHCSSTMKHLTNMEYQAAESLWISELTNVSFAPENGCFALPEKPGLSVELKVEAFKNTPIKKRFP